MADGAEVAIVEAWLQSALSGASAVSAIVGSRIYEGTAPENTTYPYLTYHLEDIKDVRGVGTSLVMIDTLYVVKAIAPVEVSALADLAQKVHTVLTTATGGSVSSGVVVGLVFSSIRERQVSYREVSKGVEYHHLGGAYRIFAQSA